LKGISHPLESAIVCSSLFEELNGLRFRASVEPDMVAMHAAKIKARGTPVAPMHDGNICDFSNDRAFWTSLTDTNGSVLGLQAFRCDYIATSLADWCAPYMIGIYMQRQELMIPSHAKPPSGSISERLTGRLVYHGEIWVDKQVKNRRVFEAFTKLGIIIAYIKWNPDAVWGLASAQMAGHGHVNRIGYTTIERGFLRWDWASEGIDPVEYLCVIERNGIAQMIAEATAAKAAECPPVKHALQHGH
jgi:hypothetical protein